MKTFVIIFLMLATLSCETANKKNLPSGLMTELIREPANIPVMDLKPEFSWIVPANAIYQTGYQIIVASSKENIQNNIADIWDSDQVHSDLSTEVELGGDELEVNSSFFWKVRIWDNQGSPSEYSIAQSFTTGSPVNYLTTENRFQTKLIGPENFIKIDEGHYFADFGKDAFGTLVLNLNAVSEDTLTIHLGEKTIGQSKVDPNPGGSIRYHKVLLPVSPGKSKYIVALPEDVRNTGPAAIHLPDSFGVITPFRYCELENCHFEITADNLSQKAYYSYFDDDMSSFTSSDSILNKIWDLCKYSIKATSFAGIYVDGDRERIPYEADAYINQLGHYYTDREYSVARRTNEYFIDHPTWPTEWILQTVSMFYNDFIFTGNIESVRYHYESLKHKTLIALSREDGLISSKKCTAEIMKNIGFSNPAQLLRDIVDWPPAQSDTGWKLANPEGERDGYEMVEINTVVNAFYYNGLVQMSALAGWLNNTNDSVFYSYQAAKVKISFNEKFLDKRKGIYNDGEFSEHSSLHANMMALAFDLVPETNRHNVIDFIKSRGMACSVYGAQYLLEGLYKAGEGDYAYSLLTATNDRSWWNMIKSGSTITMEAWDMKYKPNSDWNHAWGAAPANIIPGYMWGVSPASPGYAKAVIRPQLSTLSHSRVSVPTIRGNIEAEYRSTGEKGEYLITIPANMECDFIIPVNKNHIISLNGVSIDKDLSILQLRPGKNEIITRII